MLKRYTIIGFVQLLHSYLKTKLFYNKSRLIRFPFDVRNKSNINFGIGLTTGIGCRIEAFPLIKENIVLTFGNNVQINDYVHITAVESIIIGNNVLMASKIYISDCSHGSYSGNENDSPPSTYPADRPLFAKPVVIEDNVWLGEFVSVLPGVTIGTGTIVGSNSVVAKSLPANVIAVGTPAIPIKKFNFVTSRWEKINLL
jgi:acetyltransferase-like isoleucine patch superfamily enzyme